MKDTCEAILTYLEEEKRNAIFGGIPDTFLNNSSKFKHLCTLIQEYFLDLETENRRIRNESTNK